MNAFALRVLVATLFAAVARADDLAAEADLHFQIGAERYQSGDYRGALEHFLASNRLVPNRNVAFNIGRTYERLGQFPDAYRTYAQALDAEPDPGARARIEAALSNIAPRVAVLRIVSEPPGATVYVDRKDLGAHGSTPRALAFAPGRYRIVVERPGFEAAEREVEAVLGTRSEVRFGLRQVVGTMVIEGEPAGAAVRVDSDSAEPACRVPCTLVRPPGRYVLFLAAEGYQSTSHTVDLRARESVRVVAKMTRATGSIVVEADEPEALIEVDGRSAGFTPAVVSAPLGRTVVRVSKPGFRPQRRAVEARAGEPARVRFEMEPVSEVSAASRSTEDVDDAPASVSVVSGGELRAMGYPTVVEALRGVRGLYTSDDRSYATIGVRGLGRPGDYGNRVLVLSDEFAINDQILGSSYVGYDLITDLEDVDRIEVVRGPGSVLYGTNAFPVSSTSSVAPRGSR
jgi:outer membrane receptor protein involved in Fe transport